MMIKKIFIFLAIFLFGFAVSINFIGCKKDKPKDTSSIEENSDDDIAEDDEEEGD